ncbi:MAG: response regulator [Bacteroidetes bacterium]|nr:response regulator [Bacteroidota bacterium]
MDNQKLKVIIAEDEFLIAMDIKRKLEELGFDVTSLTTTALETITKAELDKPNIIFMDVRLSGSLNGIEAAKIISYRSKVPIIFLIDDSEEKIFHQANLDISFELLSKPVSLNNLSKALKNIILKSDLFVNNIAQPPSITF